MNIFRVILELIFSEASPCSIQTIFKRRLHTIAVRFFLALSSRLAVTAAADDVVVSIDLDANANGSCPTKVSCSCSPRAYKFRLNLNGTCDNNTIEGKPGVCRTICYPVALTPPQIKVVRISEYFFEKFIKDEINYVNLKDGDTFEYTSVSNELNPNKPLEDQERKLPTKIWIKVGSGIPGGGDNDFRIYYDVADCDAKPIVTGDAISWLEVVEYTPAISAFCDATDPPTANPTALETEPPTKSPTDTSMSYAYSASYSTVAHAKATKASKRSKNGKLLRTRN